MSILQACKVLELQRSVYYHKSRKDRQEPLRARIKEIAATRVRYGFKRIHVLLLREGWKINHKRVYRLYREEGLSLRYEKQKRRYTAKPRSLKQPITMPNQCWSMDFVSDSLHDGRRFRALTVLDVFTRESLTIHVGQSIRGEQVVHVLELLCTIRGIPTMLRCDNGPEFISRDLDAWAYKNSVSIDFSRPGKPTDNAFIESFNGRFRQECLNYHWFMSLEDAKDLSIILCQRFVHEGNRPSNSIAKRLKTAPQSLKG